MAGTIVTPEAVVLEFETAGVGSRMVARAIDAALQAVVFLALALGGVAIAAVAGSVGLAGVFVAIFVVLFGYPVALETLWRGRTPGKAALGLRVVTVEGSPIRFRHAAIRAFLGLVDVYLLSGAIGIVTMLLNRRSQRLGDIIAGTLVVRERTGAAMPTAVVFAVPVGYESYAASLDVSGVSVAEYGTVRAFLLRAASLDPARRYELARQLATPLLSRLRSVPPSWVGPEAVLACVAAVYQRRSRGGVYAPASPEAAVPARPVTRPASSAQPEPPADGYVPPG